MKFMYQAAEFFPLGAPISGQGADICILSLPSAS